MGFDAVGALVCGKKGRGRADGMRDQDCGAVELGEESTATLLHRDLGGGTVVAGKE